MERLAYMADCEEICTSKFPGAKRIPVVGGSAPPPVRSICAVTETKKILPRRGIVTRFLVKSSLFDNGRPGSVAQ